MNIKIKINKMDKCTICLEPLEKSSPKLNCGHCFHEKCISQLIRPFCPICKADITKFLLESGVSQKTINAKITEDNLRICCDGLDDIPNRDLTGPGLLALIYNAKKANPGEWLYVYTDIIIDKISNTRHLLSEISQIKHSKGKSGIFIYSATVARFVFDCVNFRIGEMTGLEYVPLTGLAQDDPLMEEAKNLVSRIKDPKTEFGVIISMMDNTEKRTIKELLKFGADVPIDSQDIMYLSKRLMSTNPTIPSPEDGRHHSGITDDRPSNSDILNSLRRCLTCRCSGHSERATNSEYVWAKKYLRTLKRRK